MGDIGVRATEEIIEDLKEKVKENKIKQPEECKHLLIETIKEKMNLGENAYDFENKQSIVMLIGVMVSENYFCRQTCRSVKGKE